MKSTNIKTILAIGLFTIISLFSSGCKRDKTQTRTELLTASGWKPISYKGDGVETIDMCEKDDVFTFNVNNTFNFSFGTDNCDGEEEAGTYDWSFISNETKIVIDGDTN